MKDIKECAKLYKQLLNRSYIFTLENNISFTIYFKPDNFFHIIGLHKLTDLEKINNNSKSTVFKKILNGEISQNYIEKSLYYKHIKNRILYFENILDMFDKDKTKVIIDFDISLLNFDSDLQFTKYILYKHLYNGCAHTTIGYRNHLYPETFFFDSTNQYLTNQNLLEIKNIVIAEKKKKANI